MKIIKDKEVLGFFAPILGIALAIIWFITAIEVFVEWSFTGQSFRWVILLTVVSWFYWTQTSEFWLEEEEDEY